MKKKDSDKLFAELPAAAGEYIRLVVKKMGYRRKVRKEVQAELIAHFEDELSICQSDKEKEEKAQQLIAGFGDAKLLGVLMRRAKNVRPLWRTVFARCFQVIGIAFLCLILYCIYLSLGRPTISVNYVERACELARPAADESLNAAPLYQKAFGLYVQEPRIADKSRSDEMNYKPPYFSPGLDEMNDELVPPLTVELTIAIKDKRIGELMPEEFAALKKWIADNNEALAIFKQATKKPYCWWKREAKDNVMYNMLLPELSKIKRFCYLLCWRAKLATSQGRIDDAFDDIFSCYRAGMHYKGPRKLIEQLAGVATEAFACNTSLAILQESNINSDKLRSFQNEFEKLIESDTFTLDFRVEKFTMDDIIQRSFTDNGCGSGHLIPGKINIPSLSLDIGDIVLFDDERKMNLEDYGISLGFALIGHDRRTIAEKFRKTYDNFEKWAEMTPYQKHQMNFNIDCELGRANASSLKRMRNPFYYIKILMPASDWIIGRSYLVKVQCEAVVTVLAILRYKQDKGEYPEMLNQLVKAGYLKQIPIDPYSDKPLVYRKTDGNFILYSVGLDFTDDGGEFCYGDDGRARIWLDKKGDAVFWPRAENKAK